MKDRRKQIILEALSQGPATASELGAILHPDLPGRLAMRRCSAWLSLLKGEGLVIITGQLPRANNPGDGRGYSNIYALAPAKEGSK